MESNKFDAMLPLITADAIGRIAKKYGIDEDKAMSDFGKSQLYSLLEKEETKVWQYSTDMLIELYDRELNGYLVFPEV